MEFYISKFAFFINSTYTIIGGSQTSHRNKKLGETFYDKNTYSNYPAS